MVAASARPEVVGVEVLQGNDSETRRRLVALSLTVAGGDVRYTFDFSLDPGTGHIWEASGDTVTDRSGNLIDGPANDVLKVNGKLVVGTDFGAFVSSNKKRDGTLRKLKIELAATTKKTQKNLVVKARKSYVAPKG